MSDTDKQRLLNIESTSILCMQCYRMNGEFRDAGKSELIFCYKFEYCALEVGVFAQLTE